MKAKHISLMTLTARAQIHMSGKKKNIGQNAADIVFYFHLFNCTSNSESLQMTSFYPILKVKENYMPAMLPQGRRLA